MLGMADKTFRNLNYIEEDIFYWAMRDIGEELVEPSTFENEDEISGHMRGRVSHIRNRMDSCTLMTTLDYYLISEVMRTLTEDYKTPVLEYIEDHPIRSAEFEKTMWTLLERGFGINYEHPSHLFELVSDVLFYDRDWEIEEEIDVLNDDALELVSSALSIDIGYYTPTILSTVENLEESLNWLSGHLADLLW